MDALEAKPWRGKWCVACGRFVRPTDKDRCPRCGESLRGFEWRVLGWDRAKGEEEAPR